MIPTKTARAILKAQWEIDKALSTNRLKGFEELPLQQIKAKLDSFVTKHGLKGE